MNWNQGMETTEMTDTTNQITIVPGLLGTSFGLYGTGVGVLTVYPQAVGQYWSYLGTQQQVTIAKSLDTAITNAGMELVSTGYRAAPLPVGGEYYSVTAIGRQGNAATIDALNVIKDTYGSSLSNVGMDLSGVSGRPQNIYTFADGITFRPDLNYTNTDSFWSGATAHFDETKAVSNLTGSARNLDEVAQYGLAISEVNAASDGMRAFGSALRDLGVIGGVAGVGLAANDQYQAYLADGYQFGSHSLQVSVENGVTLFGPPALGGAAWALGGSFATGSGIGGVAIGGLFLNYQMYQRLAATDPQYGARMQAAAAGDIQGTAVND